jgi:hypothetical protein
MTCHVVSYAEPEAFHPDGRACVRQHHVGFPMSRTLVYLQGDSAASPFLKGRNLKLQIRVSHDPGLQLVAHVLTNVS